jgi:chitin disaccharide deacetylase
MRLGFSCGTVTLPITDESDLQASRDKGTKLEGLAPNLSGLPPRVACRHPALDTVTMSPRTRRYPDSRPRPQFNAAGVPPLSTECLLMEKNLLPHAIAGPLSLALIALFAFYPSVVRPAGAAEPKKYLIIHADDAGMSHSVNVATIAALENGLVTSASIMVPCPWFKEFAEYAKTHPQYDYGIHLTLNSEWDLYRWGPVAPATSVPSLIDPEGYLWDNTDQVRQHVQADEVRIELKAQIDRALAFGVPLSHLDTHMGAVMTRPDLVEVYVELAREYKLPVLFLSRMDAQLRREYPALADRFDASLPKLREARLPVLDMLYQFYGGDIPAKRRETYEQALRDLSPGVNQLIIHCGIDNDELKAITTSSARREQDYRLFTDPAMRELIEEQGIELISWKQLTALQPE